MTYECYKCGKNGAVKDFVVNNSNQFDEPTHYTTELDVSFDVEFNGEDVKTVKLCDVCHRDES